MENPLNPLITPDKDPSELQKFPIYYEHVSDNRNNRPTRRRSSKPTTRK